MIDIKLIRENPEKFKKAIADKGREVNVDDLIRLDLRLRELTGEIDQLRHERKSLNQDQIDRARAVKEELKILEEEAAKIEQELNELLMNIPNPPAEFVPIGTEADSQVIKTVGEPTKFDFQPKEHIELGVNLGVLDFERAAKVSGSRFVAIKNDLALLELSLIRYVVDKLTGKGFEFIIPPQIINSKAMRGMGYLEHGGDQETYYLEKDDMYLIGTSEHVVGSMRADETFQMDELPYRTCALSSCFRREAGSYGKDTKGMFRVHQFDKIEMFVYTTPDKSKEELENLLAIEEEIVQDLGLPYQVLLIASGDLGDPAAAKYDIETWMPGQNKYRETHSVSTTTDYQARRLNIRYKTSDGQSNFVHTLNGTAVAVGRMLIAIMENYQNEDGSITVPKVLVNYFGKEKISHANHHQKSD